MLIAQIDSEFTTFTRKQIGLCIRDAIECGVSQTLFHYPATATTLHQTRNHYFRYWRLYHQQFADTLRNEGYKVSVVGYDSLLIEGLTP